MASQKKTGLLQDLDDPPRRERRRTAANGWVRTEPPARGLERMEAFFHGRAYAPHRHDVYAIGMTVAGVQCFDYLGQSRHSLAGRVIVLHPDEVHDGAAGTDAGFRYRMLYLDPALVSAARGGAPLPFVRDGVSDDARLRSAAGAALGDFGEPVDDLRRGEIVLSIAEALAAAAGDADRSGAPVDTHAIARTRDYLSANTDRQVDNADLEAVSGLDRWALARQFRVACGTSPYRYFVMRRLERVRAGIAAGSSLADAALSAGFADQSHMTRHFTHAYGMPPGRWQRLCGAA
jgi:AraC-like DNA-binding protein